MNPLVSILTPSYNQAGWLPDNLQSVENQTWQELEHIVMDGGSTDDTVDILAGAGPRVSWTSEADRGQSHALNKAFAASRGEIIGWINSDDAFVDRRCVEAVVDAFAKHPDVGVIYGHGLLVSQENVVMQVIWAPPYFDSVMERQTFFIQPSVFLRRSVLEDPFVNEDLHFVMDRDLWLRLRGKTRFLRLPVFIGLDRQQPARKSMMQGMSSEISRYEAANGLDINAPIERYRRKATNVTLRWLGAPAAMMLPSRIDPAVDLDFRNFSQRLANQVAIPRAHMARRRVDGIAGQAG